MCVNIMGTVSSLPENAQDRVKNSEKESDTELAYEDQGCHEMEFTHGNESELHERKQQCQKNPGHIDFIPVREFIIEHLPEPHREFLVFEFISSLINLTVRLAVDYTSKNRPSNYPLYKRRGHYGLTAFGTGWVWSVDRNFAKMDGCICPCKSCRHSPDQAKRQWGMFVVSTAKHVVFDSSEARHTECDLFYDSDYDSSKDRQSCSSLQGVEVVNSNIKTDYCHIRCITHDGDVSNLLEEMVRRYDHLRSELQRTREKWGFVDPHTAVVISHPHGLSKHLTVGEYIDRQTILPYKHIYNAETCAGSSGAPVCKLGSWFRVNGLDLSNTTHSGCHEKGRNESTSGLW